jgi:plastocyanin
VDIIKPFVDVHNRSMPSAVTGGAPVAGEIFTYTFAVPGMYSHYCRPHAEFMAGTVRVTAG